MKQDVQNQPVKKGNPYMGFLGVILIVLILNGLVFRNSPDSRSYLPIMGHLSKK